jgi:uncharacterized protein (DUF885 family)
MTDVIVTDNGLAFDRWFDGFLDDYLKRRPVSATFMGAHQYDHALPDFSTEADADLVASAQELIARLDAIPSDGLAEAQVHDRALARGFLEIQLWEVGSPFFQAGNPSHHTGEAAFSVISLFQRDAEPQDDRVDAAIQRMRTLPAFLQTARERVAQAPLLWTERAIREADAGAEYFSNGIHILAAERGIERPEFLQQATVAAQAFSDHAAWLRNELATHPIPFEPAGVEAFDRYLQEGHFLPAEQNTQWWLDHARAQLTNATKEMQELAESIDPTRSWKEQLAEIPDHHPTADRYYQSFGEVWETCRQQAIDAELVTWPDFPIDFGPIPRSDRQAAKGLYYLYYRCPPPFGYHDSHHYVVPPCEPDMTPEEQEKVLRSTNDAQITLNHVIHHAGLGHHVQNYNAFRAESRVGQMAGTDCASRVAMFCSGTLVEGWACYATELMEEIGALTDLQRLSEAQTRLRMAARAVADTAIHSGEFSLEQAARFYEGEAGMPASAALGEAVKNSMFPGAAVMYLSGTSGIHALRKQLTERDGAAFDLRSFHDRFLSYGAIPVALIARSMLGQR